jgi:hypothetical protein
VFLKIWQKWYANFIFNAALEEKIIRPQIRGNWEAVGLPLQISLVGKFLI